MNLSTIERITEIKPHPNADRIEIATCCNYQCIVPIKTYHIGDLVVFIHPDSRLPKDKEWAAPFLKFCNNRVKAVRFRDEWSFGIIAGYPKEFNELGQLQLYEGQNVANELGVIKYEAPINNRINIDKLPNNLRTRRKYLPHNLPKTDESRWQSVRDFRKLLGRTVDVTLKIDGQSWTAYYKDGDFGVTSRSKDYQIDAEDRNNFTRHLDKYPIQENLTKYCVDNKINLAIRGESYGNGIQNFKVNPHTRLEPGLALFSVFNLDKIRYERRNSPLYIFKLANELRLPTVPIIEERVKLTMDLINHYEDVEDMNGKIFEGVVINGDGFSFKVINKLYDSLK